MTGKKIKLPQFTNELADDDYLWRYFDLKGFLYLVTMKSIYFSRVDKFEDANEGLDLRQLMEKKLRKDKYGNHFLEVGKLIMRDDLDKDHELNQKKYFVSCWHHNSEESPLMWSIYSNPDGIAIKIKYKDLKDLFNNAYINWTRPEDFEVSVEKIRYIDIKELVNQPADEINNLNKFCLFKESGYKYENEVRIIAKSKDELRYNNTEITSVDVFLKNSKLQNITGIFHPKASEWFQNTLQEIVKKLDIKIDLQKSMLEFR